MNISDDLLHKRFQINNLMFFWGLADSTVAILKTFLGNFSHFYLSLSLYIYIYIVR